MAAPSPPQVLEALRAIRRFMRLLGEAKAKVHRQQLDASFGEALARAGHVLDEADDALLSLNHVEHKWVFEAAALLRAHFDQLRRDAWNVQRNRV